MNCISAEIQYQPSFEWFVKVLSFPTVCFNYDEIYDKRSPRNRCLIATAQGVQMLTVPLQEGRNQKKALKDILIANDNKWQRDHINAIKTALGKAPFFMYYFDEIQEVLLSHHTNLAELNVSLITVLARQLKIELNIINEPDNNIIQMKDVPAKKDITEYDQVFRDKTGFIPSCSIIDLLFNYGPDSLKMLGS
jgi:hypothetical protein